VILRIVVSIAKVFEVAGANSLYVDIAGAGGLIRNARALISPIWTIAGRFNIPITTFANLESVGSSLLTGSGPALAYNY